VGRILGLQAKECGYGGKMVGVCNGEGPKFVRNFIIACVRWMSQDTTSFQKNNKQYKRKRPQGSSMGSGLDIGQIIAAIRKTQTESPLKYFSK